MALVRATDKQVEVTIVHVRDTDPRRLNQALQYGELLYATDDETRINVEPSTRSKHLDMKPLINENDRPVMEDLTS